MIAMRLLIEIIITVIECKIKMKAWRSLTEN